MDPTYTAFEGNNLLIRGRIQDVVQEAKARIDKGNQKRIAIFSDTTGSAIDIDYTGQLSEVLDRLIHHPIVGEHLNNSNTLPSANQTKRPGRPKLGVVSKEISLLPRHWQWLSEQKGGASATLRRLVEKARKSDPHKTILQRSLDAAHKFMWDMAGDFEGFEAASRCFYRKDFVGFYENIASWPTDIKEHTRRLTEYYRANLAKKPAETQG